MNRSVLALSLTALLAACDDGMQPAETSAPLSAAPATDGPSLDLRRTGGLTEADHVEVAPGVFMVREIALDGDIAFAQMSDPMLDSFAMAADDGVAPPPPVDPGGDDTGGGGGGGGGRTYCYNYDSDYYTDSTTAGVMFGGDPSWYGSVTAQSYESSFAGHETRSDYASAYVYTYAPGTIDSVSAYGYVYINGRYIGYMSSSTAPGTYATAYGSWSQRCRAGTSMDLELTASHYMYDGGTSLSVTTQLAASAACCP